MPLTLTKFSVLENLLKLAGFLLLIGLGFASNLAIIVGGLLYVIGIWRVSLYKDPERIEAAGVFSIGLLLANLTFFSTRELAPLFDVSFGVYALLLLDIIVLARTSVVLRKSAIELPYIWVSVLFVASIIISAINAESLKEVVYYAIIYFFALVLFYCVVNVITKRESVIKIIWTTVAFGTISALAAIWQLYSFSFKVFYYPFIVVRDQEILELWEIVSRVVGTWQHPSYLGIMLASCIPLAIYLLIYEKLRFSIKFSLATAAVLLAAVLLLTNTRSSVLSAVLGGVVLLFVRRAMHGRFMPNVKQFAIIGLIACAAMALYQFVFVAEIYTKPQAWRVDASATIWGRFLRADSMSTESLVQRSQLYELAWDEFKTNPIVGIGGKNFPLIVEGQFERGTDAHNIFIQTLAETGIIGFMALLALYGTLIFQFARPTTAQMGDKLYAALFAVLVVIWFDSLFNNPLYSMRILAIFWLMAGLLVVIRNRQIYGATNN